ncbi:MAG: 30S ribosomal protein S3 [Planctomycetes bacterium RBG_16_43_13]|nr:MAG: 30S ribosomal protein S3 [Planctomycetes bacterium RBG_16_43_13]
MGQKISPTGLRMGITEDWRSKWYANKKTFGPWLVEDQKIRKFIKREYAFAGIPRIDIERVGDKIHVVIHASRPGIIIGKRGAKVDQLAMDVGNVIGKGVDIDIKEVENPELNSQIVAEAIGEQLEKRAPFKRTMRKYAEMIMNIGAQGVKIQCKGRLGGAEIARAEHIVLGKLPLQTLRAEIDYGTHTAMLTKGTIGIKVWIYKGEKFTEKGTVPTSRATGRAGSATGDKKRIATAV